MRSFVRYRSVWPTNGPCTRLGDIARARLCAGYRRIHVVLRREGWFVNHKRACRLYTEEGLTLSRSVTLDATARLLFAWTGPRPPEPTSSGRWTLCTTPWPTDGESG